MEDYELFIGNIEEALNRPDKSILTIKTMYPEKVMVSETNPEQVRDLSLYLSFDDCNYGYCRHEDWLVKYSNTLCKDLVKFDHLEKLTVYDLNLSSDLWTEFAEKSKCLKEILFLSEADLDSGCDGFNFDGDFDEDALCDIFQIPTLEKVTFRWLRLPYFPEGPSNIKYLNIDQILPSGRKNEKNEAIKQQIRDDFGSNFCTHTNITDLCICQHDDIPFQFSTLRLEELKQLENLDFDGCLDTEEDFESLKAILDLPKLTNLTVCFMIDSKVENFIYNKETDYEKLDFLKDQVDLLKYEFILKNL